MATVQSIIARAVIANLTKSTEDLNSSLLNLSSGIKHNAGVADFSVGTVLKNQSSTLAAANINAGNAKNLLNTAKGGLDEILELVQDIKDLAVQAADSSLTANDRANLNTEAQALITEIDRLADTTSFNSKNLLDGSASGKVSLTSKTGQATENYTLLNLNDFSFSGTTASGDLAASPFAVVASSSTGKTFSSATLDFTGGSMVSNATGAVVQIDGQSVTFNATGADDSARQISAATNFVAAAELLTHNSVRSFTFKDNGDGTVLVTAADLGTGSDTFDFAVTNLGGGLIINEVKFGSVNIDTTGGGAASGFEDVTLVTTGSVRAPTSATFDENLEGAFSNFIASLDVTGTQNQVTFKVDVNGTTYTADAINLFGTGGFNSKGATIKNGQVLTFRNTLGPTDAASEYTDNAFTLTVGASDVSISGGSQSAFETDLSNKAAGFLTQLSSNLINQSRDVVLAQVNSANNDHDVAAAIGTTFAGIESFDAEGANTEGDILFVGHTFGDDGKIGDIEKFSFDSATNTLSTKIDGETFSANLGSSGLVVTGNGTYNTTTKLLTVGTTGTTTLVFDSASTTDGKQLRLDITSLTDKSIDLGTTAAAKVVTDDLDTLFGVGSNPSLSFQVGVGSTNTIGVSLDSAKTPDIFLNDAGTSKTINISTVAGATEAQEVLDNALDTVLGQIATASAGITSFDSAITTNNVMIQNLDAASSRLLNTDFALESTLLAEATLKVNSAVSVLAQEQSRVKNLMSLLGLG